MSVLAFRRHLLAFVVVNVLLTAANLVTGAPWWAFWPLLAWALALTIHYLFYRSATVDDAWVDERTQDLRSKSYDLGHIDSIRERSAPSPDDRDKAGDGGAKPGKTG